MILKTKPLRSFTAALMLTLIALLAACNGGDSDDPGVGVEFTTVPEAPTAASSQLPATSVPSTTGPATTTPATTTPASPTAVANNGPPKGFIFPIAGACLPQGNQLMPNAPRLYRNGIHEGVDMYGVDNCVSIGKDTPVMAAKAGTVIRADVDYVNPSSAQMQGYLADPNTEASLDAFRGRQVWVQHSDGTVTRYVHLNGVAQGINRGSQVTAGQNIAFVGESGTPESVSNPGSEYHLHFEVRIGSSYLGAGQSAAQVRQLYLGVFTP